MSRSLLLLFLLPALTCAAELRVGFGEVDVTPEIGNKPVYLAGFGNNRKATGVADPLMARAVVLTDGKTKVALVCADVVGFFHENVLTVRKALPGFDYVVVSSTHNHEGPDTLGLWGGTKVLSGIDPEYMKKLEAGMAEAVRKADQSLKSVTARIGTKAAPELLHDARQPIVKHEDVVALLFTDSATKKPAGIVVQWNCHPETLDDKNTKISADYVGYTVDELKKKYNCPVVYLTGTVGGLMTSLDVKILDDQGNELKDGTFEKTERFGRLVGRAAIAALDGATDVDLTPIQAKHAEVYLPCDNKVYVLARQIGVLKRDAYEISKEGAKPKLIAGDPAGKRLYMRSEVGWVRLGQLDIATIPGEIYPELVLGQVPDPAPEGADYPNAPIEPAIYQQLRGPHKMIIGLGNDEIGYILPKRQWDEKAPFTYGRKSAPYGEVNSLGPETGPILCEAFRKLVNDK